MRQNRSLFGIFVTVFALNSSSIPAAELYVGTTSVSITPDQPVALDGQMRTRIARSVQTPCTATVLALESRDGDKSIDRAIFVACDLVAIRTPVTDAVRDQMKARMPDFPVEKLILNATHTHTAPVMTEGKYTGLDAGDVMRPSVYVEFLARQVVDAAAKAWNDRKPARVGWGLGHAVVAMNRRPTFADGRAAMYGKTDSPTFRGLEGHEDDGVEVLFFWDRDDQLIATCVNVACPSQEVESLSVVDADFWHETREALRAKYGKQLQVLAWTGAAGDQSPRPMYRKAAEERMRNLRGLTRKEEIARRIVAAWEEAHEGARKDIHTDVPFAHTVRTIELPRRAVTEAEYKAAQTEVEKLSKNPADFRRMQWNKAVLDRYDQQKAGSLPPYPMELHVVRIGDVAIATNSFELFTDYGVQMKARSPAIQTFIIQLAGPGTYLPTVRAVSGGGYSAVIQSNTVGPAGGQELVEQTVSAIKALWPEK